MINELKSLEEIILEDKKLIETVDIYGYEDDPATTREVDIIAIELKILFGDNPDSGCTED